MYRRAPGTERVFMERSQESPAVSTPSAQRAQMANDSDITDTSYPPSALYYVVIHLLHNPPVRQDYSWLPPSQKSQLYNVFLELSNDMESPHRDILVYTANQINNLPVEEPPDMSGWKSFIDEKFAQGYSNRVDDVVRTLYPMPIRAAGKSKRKHRKKKTYRKV
jgi:hypothetical protein